MYRNIAYRLIWEYEGASIWRTGAMPLGPGGDDRKRGALGPFQINAIIGYCGAVVMLPSKDDAQAFVQETAFFFGRYGP